MTPADRQNFGNGVWFALGMVMPSFLMGMCWGCGQCVGAFIARLFGGG